MEQSFLEKLTVTQLVKKFTVFYVTRRFITVFKKIYNFWSEAISNNSYTPHVKC
jgi:hypothetical protein